MIAASKSVSTYAGFSSNPKKSSIYGLRKMSPGVNPVPRRCFSSTASLSLLNPVLSNNILSIARCNSRTDQLLTIASVS